jgi:hypothetical protein
MIRTVLNEIVNHKGHCGNKVRVVSSDQPRGTTKKCPLKKAEGNTVYSLTFKAPSPLDTTNSIHGCRRYTQIPGYDFEQNEFEAMAFRSSANKRSISINDYRKLCYPNAVSIVFRLLTYGWMPHNAGFDFLDKARANLGQIHF